MGAAGLFTRREDGEQKASVPCRCSAGRHACCARRIQRRGKLPLQSDRNIRFLVQKVDHRRDQACSGPCQKEEVPRIRPIRQNLTLPWLTTNALHDFDKR